MYILKDAGKGIAEEIKSLFSSKQPLATLHQVQACLTES